MTTEAEIARQAKVPVLAHFAEEDKWIPLDSVAAFKKAQNLSSYEWAVNPSTNVAHPIALSFKVNRNVTVEEAARIVEALKPFGIFSFNKED